MTKILGMRAVVYVRISRDRGGESLGVQRQEQDCRELCDRSGWNVVEVLVDNDVSAYSGKRRPGYERMLDLIRSGAVDVVVAWNTDRLHRRLAELVTYTDVCAKAVVTTHTVRTGPIDLSTPSGILIAQQLGAVAEYESRNRSARVRAAKDQRAASGSWSGGGRPFGWEPDGVTLRESEAKLISEATRDVLRGVSLTEIARRWRAAGVRTARGKPWIAQGVRDVLLRARNAGIRQHRGVIAGAGDWDGCVTPEEWHAVRRLLTDPDRRVSPGTEPRFLGSRRYVCGVCGETVVMKKGGRPPKRKYLCAALDKGSAMHVVVDQERADAYVVERLIAGMLEQGVGPSESHDSESPTPVDDVAEIEAAQSALATELAAGRLSAAAYSVANEQLAKRMSDAQSRSAGYVAARVSDDRLRGFESDPQGTWDALPITVKRELLTQFVTVTVHLAESRSRWTAPVSERITLDWHFDNMT